MKHGTQLNKRQTGTILAALRILQETPPCDIPSDIAAIFEECDGCLSSEGIEDLCYAINNYNVIIEDA